MVDYMFEARVDRLLSLMDDRGLDGLLVAEENNMLYLTGFSGGSLLLIPRFGDRLLYVYSVNYEAAKAEAFGVEVELVGRGEDVLAKISDALRDAGIKSLGFDSLRASTYLKLRNANPNVDLKDAGEILWSLRKVKDQSEIEIMRFAAELTSRGMNRAAETIRAGVSEREVAAEIEYEMRRGGSDGVAFDTIVASGPRSAYPHGGCGDRRIRRGDLVVVDIGAKYRSYCSDLTRTFIIGEPSPKSLRIYETVMEAQNLALKALRAGVKACEIDRIARDYISEAGYGEYFVHGLGHGVGLDVHEPPALSPKSRDILAEGYVVTVEPGIYIPGFGGVRIEDTVLILKDRAEKLTSSPIPQY